MHVFSDIYRFAVAFGAVGICALLTGCSSGSSTPQLTGQSQVRFVNGLVGVSFPGSATSPDSINITPTTTPAISPSSTPGLIPIPVETGLALGAATPYSLTLASSVAIKAVQSVKNTAIPLTTSTATIIPQMSETLVLTGVVGQKKGAFVPTLMPVMDLFPAFGIPPGGSSATAAIRVINLSPGSGSLDVYNGGTPLVGLTGVTYLSATQYVPVATGNANTLTIGVYTTPTAGNPPQQVATTTTNVGLSLLPGNSYTILLVGAAPGFTISGVSMEPFDCRILSDN